MSVIPKQLINSITLKAGEQFTLPPGATIIAATNSNALSSTCTIGDLEEFSCYVALVAAAGEEGNVTQYFESGAAAIIGYRLNDIDYPFSKYYQANDDGLYDTGPMKDELALKLGGLVVATAHGADGNNERGALTYILIKTVPSIGDNLSLLLQSSIPGAQEGYNQTIVLRSPFIKYADISDKGYNNLPVCP